MYAVSADTRGLDTVVGLLAGVVLRPRLTGGSSAAWGARVGDRSRRPYCTLSASQLHPWLAVCTLSWAKGHWAGYFQLMYPPLHGVRTGGPEPKCPVCSEQLGDTLHLDLSGSRGVPTCLGILGGLSWSHTLGRRGAGDDAHGCAV